MHLHQQTQPTFRSPGRRGSSGEALAIWPCSGGIMCCTRLLTHGPAGRRGSDDLLRVKAMEAGGGVGDEHELVAGVGEVVLEEGGGGGNKRVVAALGA